MRTKRQIPDYSDMAWRTVAGETLFWRDLEDKHLANLYGFFYDHPKRRRQFSLKYPGALPWLKQEAKRRGILHLIDAVLEYGPYPYFDKSRRAWMVYDSNLHQIVPVEDYDVNRLPPDARDAVMVRKLLTGRKKRRHGQRRNGRRAAKA